MPTLAQISAAIEEEAPLSLQQPWDNSGWQLAPSGLQAECTGCLTCLDVTPAVVAEAIATGCNLIVSHHPLIFKGLKHILLREDPQQQAVIDAIRGGVAVYSSHTALDSSPIGPSAWLAAELGLRDTSELDPATHLGIVGSYATPVSRDEFVKRVAKVYGGGLRVTPGESPKVQRVALCSGSGGEFIADAIAAGADAYVTSDMRYHDLLDRGGEIILVDTGHYESEICTKSIFSRIISEKFCNFAVRMCTCEHPPVAYAVTPNR